MCCLDPTEDGARLRVENDRLMEERVEATRLRVESNRLRVESNRLMEESNRLWRESTRRRAEARRLLATHAIEARIRELVPDVLAGGADSGGGWSGSYASGCIERHED